MQRWRQLAGPKQALFRRSLDLLGARVEALVGEFTRFRKLREADAGTSGPRLNADGMKQKLVDDLLSQVGDENGDGGPRSGPNVSGKVKATGSTSTSSTAENVQPASMTESTLLPDHQKRLTATEARKLVRQLPVGERPPLKFSTVEEEP
ncbi:unnamed protein product, partial [Amoebophrya sp. A25]|eukprot:GSA25T00021899001.1